MNKATVLIMGLPIALKYDVYEGGHVEWYYNPDDTTEEAKDKLIEILLRNQFVGAVEAGCRESSFYKLYSEGQMPADYVFDQETKRWVKEPEDIPF